MWLQGRDGEGDKTREKREKKVHFKSVNMRIRLSKIYRCERKYEYPIYMKGGNGSIER